MNLAIWIGVSVALIASFGPITYGGMRRVDDKALARYVAKVGLSLPPELRVPVVTRIAHRERAASWCGLGGLVLGVIIVLISSGAVPPEDGGEAATHGAIVMLATIVGASSGAVIGVAGPGSALNPAAPRLAHGTETSLADYLHRSELAALGGSVGIAVVAGTLAIALSPDLAMWQLTFILVTMGSVAVAGGAVFAVVWHVAGRPQRAGSELELAWNDVMRADGLRQLLVAGLLLSVMATGVIFLATVVFTDGAPAATLTLFGIGAIELAVAFALPLPFWAGRLHAYPVRRLWPSGIGMGAAC